VIFHVLIVMKKRQKYPPARVIAVDVDGTLQHRGHANNRLIKWCQEMKADGFTLMLWSARGEVHARNYAELFGVLDLFDLICSKPGYIVDDQGWGWIKYTRVIRSLGESVGNDQHDDFEADD
jgi:hydroxymethylpyrimidine pyrophosphatase-like HAD family hydrolase